MNAQVVGDFAFEVAVSLLAFAVALSRSARPRRASLPLMLAHAIAHVFWQTPRKLEGISMGPRTHLILGIAVVLILPALSWWHGTGAFAFTMFSGSGSYRLRIVAIDHGGNAHRVPPTAVAARAEGSVGNLLAGSEEWRFAPFGPLLRQRINQIATLGCGARAGSQRVRVTLEERRTLDAPVRISDETVVCP